MSGDITLSSAVRTSLLSLQSTTNLINQTQNRLSTGLKVSGPVDDPSAYFQAKSLNDRSSDFTAKKDGIDQGVSTVSAALDAVNSIETVVNQLKGVAQSLKSATQSQVTDLVSQFNSLRTQISSLATDATYQGTNLVNSTAQILTVSFSEKSGSLLTVTSQDLTETGLSVGSAALIDASGTTLDANYAVGKNVALGTSTTAALTFTYEGNNQTLTSGASLTLNYGTASLSVTANTSATVSLTQGQVITLGASTGATAGTSSTDSAGTAGTGGNVSALTLDVSSGASGFSGGAITLSTVTVNNTNYVSAGTTTQVNNLITQLDTALTTLRAQAQTLGSNVALLKTRLDFTTAYTNELTSGAGKLTLADINEEGANLLALQTRQQLGVNALSFAGQAEKSILSLFR